ncbi:MAG: hypothetical protein O3A20_09815 [Planctomycetota bacterium]|nr:hypothetical protein [Planctomycetota bacterium]
MLAWGLALVAAATVAALLGWVPTGALRSRPVPEDSGFRAPLIHPKRLEEFETWLARAAPQGESCGYQHLGLLADGTHVLRTAALREDSRVVMNLLFLRLESDSTNGPDGTPCTHRLVQATGSYPLGEQDDARIEVLPERVLIGASHNRPTAVALAFGR